MWGISKHGVLIVAALAAATLFTGCSSADRSDSLSGGSTASTLSEGAPPAMPAPRFGPPPPPIEDAKRDVVKTASMTVSVGDTSAAADKAAVIAENAKGRVDSRTEDAGSGRGRAETSIVLRVPVAELDAVVRELKTLGTVQHAETTSDDVTAQRVDLDARIKALQTSVDRLLAIMRDAKDSEALVQAEQALSQRQAELDSLRAQRDQLGDRIAMSTVNVSFVAEQIGGPAPEQYQGFFGQVHRGWDALVSLIGNMVLVIGLLLPWLGALAVAGLVVFGLVRLVTSRGRTATPQREPTPAAAEPSGGAPDSSLE